MNDQQNNQAPEREVYIERGSDGGGNAVAIVALLILALLVIGGAIYFFRGAPAEEPGFNANVDVNLPNGDGGSGGSGGGGGSTQ